MRKLALLVCAIFFCLPAFAKSTIFPVPDAIRTDRFVVTIDGRPASFAHAAANYYFLNFDIDGKAEISITAPTDDYWAKGVEVQPWSANIRPRLKGRTVTFTLSHPAKLSITRPNDHVAGAEMLFLFANAPEKDAPKPQARGIHYYGPGVYHESIDAKSGDTIYLAPGAVIFGSLNLWQVENVKVFGRGVIVYDGPQDPTDDTGWMQQPNWHAIVMNNARNISISGITCVVRSRTWMIQMKDSRFITFDNVKVIGGSDANANQDGMDWLGGGDTLVHDAFIRSADDIFAMQGNWDGYDPDEMIIPGHDVTNITVEDSVLSTSISNVVRAGWPTKTFNAASFVMRNSDVIHAGIGACTIPFGLLELWANPTGGGTLSGFHFENIRLEDWYSLMQIEKPEPAVRNITFKNVWAIETPAIERSTLLGDVDGVQLDHVRLASRLVATNADIPVDIDQDAQSPVYQPNSVRADFTYSVGLLKPGQKVRFDASNSGPRIKLYQWFFGDGTTASGETVTHKFPDAHGTLWDNTGRFRVMLKVVDKNGNQDWLYQPVVVATSLHDADANAGTDPGLDYAYYEATSPTLAALSTSVPTKTGSTTAIDSSIRKRAENYAVVESGFLNIPVDGGYTFTLLARDEAKVEIDGVEVATSLKPYAQVCGVPGYAVQSATGSIALHAGRHSIRVSMTYTTGAPTSRTDGFGLLWQGPGTPMSKIPSPMLTH